MNPLVEASDQELEVLENIYAQRDHVRQRDLARIAGLSLGMTNAIVKRLVQKGWLSIRKVNNRNIRYAVSAEGIDQISRRSYRYLKRTIKNIVYYREAIERFVREVKGRGYSGVMLVGPSDLDFIVEHACDMYAVSYLRNDRAAAERASVQRVAVEPGGGAERAAEGDSSGAAPRGPASGGDGVRGTAAGAKPEGGGASGDDGERGSTAGAAGDSAGDGGNGAAGAAADRATFLLYSESYIPDAEEKARGVNLAFLQEVVKEGALILPAEGGSDVVEAAF